ncbi:MAG TPA: hypothetical protein VIC63_05080 [Candidatus Limnocylindria bacterium]|jgi:hypothetical protein
MKIRDVLIALAVALAALVVFDPFMALLVGLVVVLVTSRLGGHPLPGGGSGTSARPRDPDAVAAYSLDPATMSYHLELPSVAPGPNLPAGSGPPNRRRRRYRAG